MRKKLALFLALLMLAGLMAACGGTAGTAPGTGPAPEASATPSAQPTAAPSPAAVQTPAPSPAPTPTPEPEPTPEPTPEPEPAYRNPFNGAPLEERWTARPYALMVNNHPDAQPQCGIAGADIIYELLAEGQITRMLMIFSDMEHAGTLGSIRSVRPYYQDICLGYGAVLVHAGGSEEAYDRISSMHIQNIDGVRGWYNVPVFYRDQDRLDAGYALEHTLFARGEDIVAAAREKGYSQEVGADYDSGLRFSGSAAPETGDGADTVSINFNNKRTTLNFDPETGTYTAEQLGKPYADGLTGEVPAFSNVLILYAPIYVIDDYGRLRVDLVGSGEGFYARNGRYIPITWSKTGVYAPFTYRTEEGEGLALIPGKTYIAILSRKWSTLEFSEG